MIEILLTIDFTALRWEQVVADARKWWLGQLERPLIQIRLRGVETSSPKPDIPSHKLISHYDFSIPPEQIVQRWDYDLSKIKFLGDSFPNITPNFGAGCVAAFLGAQVYNTEDTTWFVANEDLQIKDIILEMNETNEWLKRAKAVCQAAINRWAGTVQVDMLDLGSILDILSTFRPSDSLLFDLYDHPEEVDRLTWQLDKLWMRYFQEFNALLHPSNPGYTTWTPILSDKPYYMLQSSLASSLSPSMFDRFVKPQLAAACRKLPYSFYRIDGPEQLIHLDALLDLEELNGIQWISSPNEGNADSRSEVCRRVRATGKLLHIGVADEQRTEDFDRIVEQLGSPAGLLWIQEGNISEEEEFGRFLEKFGIT